MTVKNSYFRTTNHVIGEPELLNRAHRVRTNSGEIYINHLNGYFYSVKGNSRLTLSEIYPMVVAVFATNRRLIAKRKGINRPLLAGVIVKKRQR